MSIEYRSINANTIEKIDDIFGEGTAQFVVVLDDGFLLEAYDGDSLVGFINVTPRALTYTLEHLKDAYIETVEVHEKYRRRGIGRALILAAQEWAIQQGFKQIRTHHDNEAAAAIKMSMSLGFGMCPHAYSDVEGCEGYHVAKVLAGGNI